MLDERTPGHWTLQPGYLRTVSQAIGEKEAEGRVRGAEHLTGGVQQGRISADEIFIRINQRGFRGPEIDDAHSKPRILTIGDSCTFGTVEAHTYPTYSGLGRRHRVFCSSTTDVFLDDPLVGVKSSVRLMLRCVHLAQCRVEQALLFVAGETIPHFRSWRLPR